ncbi:hypothetical protein Ancab_007494 [Ancistrocladus abbreviatus]
MAGADQGNWPHAAAAANTESFSAVPLQQAFHDASTSTYSLHQLHGLLSCPAEDRPAASASKSHSQAEKRRRDRINAQLASLRKLIPNSEKMDKAALLASTVDHIKDLKGKATETSRFLTIPTEVDEVKVECCTKQEADLFLGDKIISCNKNNNSVFIKATLCCEDRSELFSELIPALKDLKLTTVGGDIACLGGRVRTNLILSVKDGEEGVCIATLQQPLKAALSRMISSYMTPNFRVTSRRQRLLLLSNSQQLD